MITGRVSRKNGFHTGPVLFILTFAGAVAWDVSATFAQGNRVTRTSHTRERTREYIDDYSNSLGTDGDFGGPRKPERRGPSNQGQIDAKALRGLIHTFSDSMTQLTFDLNDQTSQIPGLRQLYTESLRLSGTAVNIFKRSEKQAIDGAMLDDLQQLDADWRELAYRLANVRSLSEDSSSLVDDLNGAMQKIRQLINIQPQFDRRQLNLKSAALAAVLDNLQDDIASELGNSPDTQFYRRSINRARQVVLNMVTLIRDDRSDSSVIVDEYKQFETIWTPLVAKLRAEDDRSLERSLRRVVASANEIHQLLLLPRKVDPNQFAFLAKNLKRDVDEFLERTPLVLVLRLPNSKQALAAADQLNLACANFSDMINRGGEQNQIVESFRRVEQAVSAFNGVYREIDSDKAIAVLNRINQTTLALRSSLQIQSDDFDDDGAADLAASIQNFTDQLTSAANRWLDQDRQPFAEDCLQGLSDMSDRIAKLHDDIVIGKPANELKAEMTELYDNWRQVYAYLIKCQTEDRATLGRLASSLTPALVDLRTIITQ